MLYATLESVCHIRYFYSAAQMCKTSVALVHTIILGDLIPGGNEADFHYCLSLLCRICVFWHDLLVSTSGDLGTILLRLSDRHSRAHPKSP